MGNKIKMALEIDVNAEIRKQIDDVVSRFGPHGFIDHLPPEITLVQSANDIADCEKYGIGTAGWRHLLLGMFPDVETPIERDTVLYYSEAYGVNHVGRYQKDGKVISKWGTGGPVLKHPIDFVPTIYGDTVFFRRISSEDLQSLGKRRPIIGPLIS